MTELLEPFRAPLELILALPALLALEALISVSQWLLGKMEERR